MSGRSFCSGVPAVAWVLIAVASAAAAMPSPVLTTRANEQQPAPSPGYFAWTEAPRAHPTRVSAYVKPDGQPRFRVNARGTLGAVGSGAIDGTRLVYQQRPNNKKPGNVQFFDLISRVRSDPPPGVNTRRHHEKHPSLSGDWLLFVRETFSTSTERIMLFNLTTRETRQLDVARGRAYAQGGGLTGAYAAWVKCPRPSSCNAYVYDIGSRAKFRVPNPSRKSQYAVSINPSGLVYFAESSNINCGPRLALWRYALGGTRTKLLSLPRGRDVSVTSPLDNADGTTSLFYDRFVCRTGASDIFKLALGP